MSSHRTVDIGVVALALLCAGCDGNSNNQKSNRPPTITSAATATVAENMSGTVYNATASDPDGDPLTYQISGGEDAAAFTITPAGALSFGSAPDFESPADANRDNDYRVILSASDGTSNGSLALLITVTNTADGIQVQRIATGFSDVVAIRPAPPANDMSASTDGAAPRIFIGQKNGVVSILNSGTGEKKTFIDLRSANLSSTGFGTPLKFADLPEGGLLDFLPAPGFENGRSDYAWNKNTPFWMVSFTTDTYELRVLNGEVASNREMDTGMFGDVPLFLSSFSFPANATHFGGKMAWSAFQTLMTAIGDGGSGENVLTTNPDGLGILSVRGPARPATSGYGLQNPTSLTSIGNKGEVVFTDAGSSLFQEINVSNGSLGFFGWPYYEGTTKLRDGFSNSIPLVSPTYQYGHGATGNDKGTYIIGGVVYGGSIPALANRYIFADRTTGNIWSIPASLLLAGGMAPGTAIQRLNQDLVPNQGAIAHPTAIGMDAAKNLYIADQSGDIFLVRPAPQ